VAGGLTPLATLPRAETDVLRFTRISFFHYQYHEPTGKRPTPRFFAQELRLASPGAR